MSQEEIKKHLQLLTESVEIMKEDGPESEKREVKNLLLDIQGRLSDLKEELDGVIRGYLPEEYPYWSSYGLAHLSVLIGDGEYMSNDESIQDLIDKVDEIYADRESGEDEGEL